MVNLLKFMPGDRAIVVSSNHPNRIGKYVTILECEESGNCLVQYDIYIGTTVTYRGGISGNICRGSSHNYEHIIKEITVAVTNIFTNKVVTAKLNGKDIYIYSDKPVRNNQTVHLKGYSRKDYFVALEIL